MTHHNTVICGRVRTCCTAIGDPGSPEPHVYVRVLTTQGDGGADWEALLHVGKGNAAAAKADAMRDRLSLGVEVEAHGAALALRLHPKPGQPHLVLTGTTYIRGGDHPRRHQPTDSVLAALRRLQRDLEARHTPHKAAA